MALTFCILFYKDFTTFVFQVDKQLASGEYFLKKDEKDQRNKQIKKVGF